MFWFLFMLYIYICLFTVAQLCTVQRLLFKHTLKIFMSKKLKFKVYNNKNKKAEFILT